MSRRHTPRRGPTTRMVREHVKRSGCTCDPDIGRINAGHRVRYQILHDADCVLYLNLQQR